MDEIYKDVNRNNYLSAMFIELNGDSDKMVDFKTASHSIFNLVMGSKEEEFKKMLKNLDADKVKLVASPTKSVTLSKNGLMITDKGNVLIPKRDMV